MKNFFSILVLFSVILFSGCSSDDDEGEKDYSKKVVGKWIQKSYKNGDGSFTPQEDGTYLQFMANGTFTYFVGGVFQETTSGTYTMPFESIIKLKDSNENANHSSPGGDIFEIEILEISGDKATFKITDGTSVSTSKYERR